MAVATTAVAATVEVMRVTVVMKVEGAVVAVMESVAVAAAMVEVKGVAAMARERRVAAMVAGMSHNAEAPHHPRRQQQPKPCARVCACQRAFEPSGNPFKSERRLRIPTIIMA